MNGSAADFPISLPMPAVETPDEAAELALVHAAQGGCTQAFRALVERHQQRVYHFCHHYLGDAGDAREACQDTFIRAHGAIARYKPRARLSTWLFQIALNLCRDRKRPTARTRPHLALHDLAPELPCHRAAPDEAAMRDADLAKLDRGLATLPQKFREVLVLSCLEGLEHAECAAILKCSPRAIEGRLYRARQALAVWWDRTP
ncbi:RNA polymerase sigma factor [Luteolibacter flavescens]|uniref:RNA polymerase sigma factor n=1 Tax=Luteolibacter flavescens TaxID=1859460 RepID=A0ABT3FMR6_9BACT|nr:RNA polymerase sigma factor [Luteolibacter flavescens]MCW1884865.1 RNA polymerase sigma factor [Luteolibacter flavescens]